MSAMLDLHELQPSASLPFATHSMPHGYSSRLGVHVGLACVRYFVFTVDITFAARVQDVSILS